MMKMKIKEKKPWNSKILQISIKKIRGRDFAIARKLNVSKSTAIVIMLGNHVMKIVNVNNVKIFLLLGKLHSRIIIIKLFRRFKSHKNFRSFNLSFRNL